MRELTAYEVEEVASAWGPPGAGVGALAGAAGYLGSSITSGNFSWKGLTTSIAVGGALGAIGGPVGAARAYFLPRAAFAGGMCQGLFD